MLQTFLTVVDVYPEDNYNKYSIRAHSAEFGESREYCLFRKLCYGAFV